MALSAQRIPTLFLMFRAQRSRFAESGAVAGFDLLQSFKQMMVRTCLSCLDRLVRFSLLLD